MMIRFPVLSILLLSVTLCSCVPSNAQPVSSDNNEYVIVLGFDGWGSVSFEDAEMPFLKSMMHECAWTLHKRSVLPSSSACNWASMFKGAGPEAHGYIDWDTKTPAFEVTEIDEKGNFPSFFSIYRKAHPNSDMVYLYQWDGMKYLFDMEDFTSSRAMPNTVSGSDTMGEIVILNIMGRKPSLLVSFWDFPDKIGHSDGWYSDEYMAELKHIDSIIEAIVNACKEAEIIDKTLIVITSDHGGHDKTHGQPMMADLETPLFLFGPGIKPGEINGPVMQYDVAAILADYLKLNRPSGWRGKTPEGLLIR